MRRLANLGLSLLLTGLVAIALAVAAIPAMTGTQAVTITASSMQQVLPQGSLVYIAKKDSYELGDYVTYRQGSNFVTHEVISFAPNPRNAELDGAYLQTKGTSNSDPDPYTVRREDVLGHAVYHLPWAGVALTILGKPVTQAFLALLALSLYLVGRSSPKTRTYRLLKTPGVIQFAPGATIVGWEKERPLLRKLRAVRPFTYQPDYQRLRWEAQETAP